MDCPSCRHANRETARFCEECGSPLARACAGCGIELRPGAKFCDACGQPVALPAGTRTPAASASARSPAEYTPKHLADKILSSKVALDGADGHKEIEASLDRSDALIAESGARAFEPLVMEERARLAKLRGDEATARSRLEQALALCEELKPAATHSGWPRSSEG